MLKYLRLALPLLFFSLALASCDSIQPADEADLALVRLSSAGALGKNADAPAFSLFTSAAATSSDSASADSAYLYRAFALQFSSAIEAEAHGKKRKVRFTVQSADGTVLRLANAVVPGAPRALAALEEMLLAAVGARKAEGSGKASSSCWPGEKEVIVTWWEEEMTENGPLYHLRSETQCIDVFDDEEEFEGPSPGGDPFEGPGDPGDGPCWECGGGPFPPPNPCEVNPALPECSADLAPQVEASAIHDWFSENCGVDNSVDVAEANNRWSDNIAQAFGIKVEGRASNRRTLDGYVVHNGYITKIYEVKNTKGKNYTFSGDDIDQAIAHIDRLIEHREALRRNGGGAHLSITSPTYVVVTTSQQSKLDYHNQVFEHARRNGISLHVYRPRSAAGNWYLDGERVNSVFGGYDDWYAGIPYGAAPDWTKWIDPTRELSNQGMTVRCEPEVVREGAPKTPPGS